MSKKGNGIELSNEYLRQIAETLGHVLSSQEGMRREQEAMRREQVAMREEMKGMRLELTQHGIRLNNIEEAVRQIAHFVGEDRTKQDKRVDDIERRVEALERRAA